MTGTKWKPHEPVEFKHVVEVSERLGRMSDDSCLLGHVWTELQSAKGSEKQLREKLESVWKCLAGADDPTAVEHSTLLRARETVARVAELAIELARLEGVLGADDRKAGMAAGGGSVLRTPNSKLMKVLERYEHELALQGNIYQQMAAEIADLRLKVRELEEVIAERVEG